MDGWRAALLAAVGLFVLYLVARLRPRPPVAAGRLVRAGRRSRRTSRLEARLLRRARELPLGAKRRLRIEIERMIEQEQQRTQTRAQGPEQAPEGEPSDPGLAGPEGGR